ncbi:MAG: amidohydrolase [Lentisphaerales bacterium]|nr:amidohydrolase [Lentisphaerales bacterium]
MNRRDFTKYFLSGAALLAPGCQGVKRKPYIDCHTHIWPKFGEYPFRAGISEKDVKPASFRAEDLMAAGKSFGFERFVLIQHIYYHGYDYSYFRRIAGIHPGKFAVVGALDKKDPKIEQKMKADAGTEVSGYRIPSKDGENWLLGSDMDRYWKLAAEYNQSICLLRNRNVTLGSVYEKCRINPQTRVVIDHYGHVDFNDRKEVEVLWRLSELENVYLKVSKYYGNGRMELPYLDMLPFFKEVLGKFGSERLMWGSDCPYQLEAGHTYKAAYEILANHAGFLTAEERQNIFQGTAEKVFFRN